MVSVITVTEKVIVQQTIQAKETVTILTVEESKGFRANVIIVESLDTRKVTAGN